MSIFVIIIHASCFFPESFYTFCLLVSRIAVPIFFIISGFFYKKFVVKQNRVIYNVFVLSCWTTVFWLIYYFVTKGGGYVISKITISALLDLLLLNMPLYGNHLWYLYALFILYCFLKVMLIFKDNNILHFFYKNNFFILFVVFLLLFASIWWGISRTWFFTGLPFFLLGKLLFDNKDFVIKKHDRILFILLILTFFLFFIENRFCCLPNSDLCFFHVPLCIGVFCFFIKYPNMTLNSICVSIGKNDVLYIYIFHILFIAVIKNFLLKFIFDNNVEYLQYTFWFSIPMVFVLSVLFSRMLLFCQKK